MPCERPNDVYSDVAARVELKRIEDEKMEEGKDAEIARELRKAMPEAVPRKVNIRESNYLFKRTTFASNKLDPNAPSLSVE